MTKIQLKRDTAANWSTNNPTPSAGEPCFETDTGKLKIGDGITAYNSLPYQGGTSATAVTTDTAQTISGKKTFTNDIVINQWNMNTSPVRETHIDLGGGTDFISASGTDKTLGMYTNSADGIQLGTSKLDYTQGLSIKPSSLTFKSSDGTVTDLLAGGSGDVTSAGNNTFTGMNIFKGTSLNIGDDNNYSDIASFSGAEYTVGDKENLTIVNPVELGASDNNTVLKSNVRVLETDTASSTKKAYSIMTKSPANNEYMAHMAMPSDKYIDLTIGASGATYTAPADGYFTISKLTNGENQNVTLINTGKDGSFTEWGTHIINRCVNPINRGSVCTFIPASKGDIVKVTYSADGTLEGFRFIYAQGSSPTV